MSEKVNIPKYSLGEELISGISHMLGGVLAIIATPFLLVKATKYQAPNFTNVPAWLAITAVAIFCFFMITEYAVSAIYHSIAAKKGKKVMRTLDHCFIFGLIIGTYAPITLLSFNPQWLGIVLFFTNVAVGAVAITLTAVNMKKYAKLSMVCYIAMGWLVIVAAYWLVLSLSLPALLWLLAGGIFYTVGAVLYGIGHKKKYIHCVWHFFVLFGTISHFLCIYMFIL